jgi:4-hydroxy-3-methylbut-2-enyl diphosphate reductase
MERRRQMKVIPITPRGFCYGVVDAVELAKQVAADPQTPRPIYILGQLVHNRHLVDRLSEHGIISLENTASRLDLLDDLDHGTVIFTAHGVSPQVKAKARAKGLHCVDTTCPDVERTHELLRELVSEGYDILYLGRKGHPEPEGALGEAPGHVFLIQDREDLDAVALPQTEKLAVTTQTTLSRWDTADLIAEIRRRFPQVQVHTEICQATQLRQEAAVRQSTAADVVFVVGDERSSNSNRLVDVVAGQAGRPVHLIDGVEAIRPEMLAGAATVAVTAGSSTPSDITRAVIRYLQAYELPVDRHLDSGTEADL